MPSAASMAFFLSEKLGYHLVHDDHNFQAQGVVSCGCALKFLFIVQKLSPGDVFLQHRTR